MFGMGWQEILVILVIAVLVIGPDQLPQVARGLGKMMAQFRRATNDLRDHVNREFNQDENFKDFKEFHQSIDSEIRSVGYTAQEFVEGEIAKEEAELTKLDMELTAEVREKLGVNDEAGVASNPASWMQDPEAPLDSTATPAKASAESGEAAQPTKDDGRNETA